MERVFIADADNTLTKGFFIHKFPSALVRAGIFPREILKEIAFSGLHYVHGNSLTHDKCALDTTRFFGEGIKGKKQSEVREVAKSYIESTPEDFFNYSLKLIDTVKNRGYKTIVLSGAPEDILIELADFMGIDEVYGTRYKINENGIYTGEIVQNCSTGDGKKQIFDDHISSNGFDLTNSGGIGDGPADLGFLEGVGYPALVNVTDEMKYIGKERNWLVCKNGDDVVGMMSSYLQI